ncbi:hypothetical protein ACLOJK_012763 [Asimina triloba]
MRSLLHLDGYAMNSLEAYMIDHGSIPLSFGSIEYTHNSELDVPPPKRHVRSGGIPIGLNGMTVSHYESVKS